MVSQPIRLILVDWFVFHFLLRSSPVEVKLGCDNLTSLEYLEMVVKEEYQEVIGIVMKGLLGLESTQG